MGRLRVGTVRPAPTALQKRRGYDTKHGAVYHFRYAALTRRLFERVSWNMAVGADIHQWMALVSPFLACYGAP